MLWAIDPGLNGCGVAKFEKEVLVWAGYVQSISRKRGLPLRIVNMINQITSLPDPPDQIALEMPQVYGFNKRGGDPNDLLPLAAINGGVLASFPQAEATFYQPREWKAQMSKELCRERVEICMSDAEKAMVIPRGKTYDHNTYDAIGIGLFHLGRFKPRKIYPR